MTKYTDFTVERDIELEGEILLFNLKNHEIIECSVELEKTMQEYTHNKTLDPQNDVTVEIESMKVNKGVLAVDEDGNGFALTFEQRHMIDLYLEEMFDKLYEDSLR